METIGGRLLKIRESRNMTQREFADVVDIYFTKITKLEKGFLQPDTKLLLSLYNDFGVDLNWLITGNGSMKHKHAQQSNAA